LVIVRWATDRWAVASAQADNWGGTRTGKTKTPNVGNADNRREAETDWNAGVPPASVRNRTKKV
jgi:hypothetical protein